MEYRISRNEEIGLVFVTFDSHVPVEVRESMMANGMSYDWAMKAWASLEKTDEEIAKIINVPVKERHAMTKAEEEELKAEYLDRHHKNGFDPGYWDNYLKGKIGALVRLEDGNIVCIEKPSIETSFCYGESGYDMDEAVDAVNRALTSEEHFRRSNLRDLDETISMLERLPGDGYYGRHTLSAFTGDRVGLAHVSFVPAWNDRENDWNKEVSEEDRERILEGYRKVRAAFEKRVNAYLKRYGLTKVRAWTYWRDA